MRNLLPLFQRSTVVLDAFAMGVVQQRPLDQPVVLTPHAGEMANLAGLTKQVICEDPLNAAVVAAHLWNTCVVLKGACTFIAQADGTAWCHKASTPGRFTLRSKASTRNAVLA